MKRTLVGQLTPVEKERLDNYILRLREKGFGTEISADGATLEIYVSEHGDKLATRRISDFTEDPPHPSIA